MIYLQDCSEVVCVSCRGSILKAAKQKEGFECSRKELVQKLHKSSSVPACNTKRAEATVRTPRSSGFILS